MNTTQAVLLENYARDETKPLPPRAVARLILRSVARLVERWERWRLRRVGLDSLINRGVFGYVMINAAGRVLDCNAAYARIVGYDKPADLIGRGVFEWLAPEYQRRLKELLATNKRASYKTFRNVYYRPDGTERLVEGETEITPGRFGPICAAVVRDVTEHKETIARMRIAERAVDAAGPGIAIARLEQDSFRYIYVNPAFERMTGFSLADIRSAPHWTLVTNPDERQIVRAAFERAMAEGAAEAKVLSRRKNGETFLRRFSVSRVPATDDETKYAVTFSEDITEAEKLSELVKLQARAIEASQNGLMIAKAGGADCPILFVNHAFEKITGYAKAEVMGRDSRFLRGDKRDQPGLALVREAIRTGTSASVVVENVRKDGAPFWNELHIDPVYDETGKVTHFIGVLSDVTQQRESAARLNQMEKLQALGQLTGGIAHDFNNLLTVIKGNLSLLGSTLHDETQQRRLALAVSAVGRGAELVQRLSAYSRTQRLEQAVVQINELIAEIEPLLHRALGEHIRVTSALAPDLWLAYVDKAQFETAILNLVINSRDAMPGGGTVRITTRNLDSFSAQAVPGLAPGDYVLITVADDGHGMPEAVRNRAFEPFFTTKKVGQGTGLGLSSVYGFIKQSNGHVIIDSAEGRGTRVSIYLPRCRLGDVVIGATTAAPRALPAAADGAVLIVEDDPEMRATVSGMLQDRGYRTYESGNAAEALRAIERYGDINVVLADVILPGGKTGQDLCREIEQARPGLPVLLASGYPRDAIPDIVHGGVRIIGKPYKLDELLDVINSAIADSKRSSRAAAPSGGSD